MKITTLLLCLTALANCSKPSDSSLMLVGGKAVAEDMFQAVVLLNNCTATKISDHHFLLAAHCVVDTNASAPEDNRFPTRIEFDPTSSRLPKSINIDTTNIHKEGHWTHASQTIVRTHVHPSYRYGWNYYDENTGSQQTKHQLAADVAVIEIKEATPTIPVMKINFEFASTATYKLGYGCESEHVSKRLKCRPADKDRNFKFGPVELPSDPQALINKIPSWVPAEIREQATDHYLISKGRFHARSPTPADEELYNEGGLPGDDTIAGLGATDSGGPLLVKKGDKFFVTAVNSKKAVWLDPENPLKIEGAAFDAHARVHYGAPLYTGEWLQSIIGEEKADDFPLKNQFLLFEPIDLKIFADLDIDGDWLLDLSLRRTTRKFLRQPAQILDVHLAAKNGACPLELNYLYLEDEDNGDDAEIEQDSDAIVKIAPGHYKIKLESEIETISSIAYGFKKVAKYTNDSKFCFLFVTTKSE